MGYLNCMGHKKIWLLGVWLTVTAAASCSTETLGHSSTAQPIVIAPAQPTTKEKPVIPGVRIPTPLDPALEKVVMQAKEDLSRRLSIPADQIELMEVQSVVWPDKGLGCPRPGMVYPQVRVDGLFMQFRAGGRLYEYHSGGGRPPFLCESSQ